MRYLALIMLCLLLVGGISCTPHSQPYASAVMPVATDTIGSIEEDNGEEVTVDQPVSSGEAVVNQADQENQPNSAAPVLQSMPDGYRYTLADCIAIALQNNANLKAQALAIAQRDNEFYASWGDFLPTLGISYNTLDYENDAKKEMTGTGRSYDTKTLLFTVTQPIFNSFSGINGLRRALMEKHSAEKNLQLAQMRLISQVRSAYYNKLFAADLKRNYEQSIARLNSQLKIATAWVEQRLAPPLRELEVKTRLAHARHQLIHAQSQEAIAISRLRSAMMLSSDSALILSDDITVPIAPLCGSLQQCRAQARSNRPELAMGALAIDTARMDSHIAISRNFPSVGLEANWADGERNNDEPVETAYGNFATENEDYYSLMLTMTFRPFQGGRNIFNWKALRKRVEGLRHQLRQQYHDVDNEVETRWLLLQESISALEPAKEAVEEAKLAYDMNKKFVKLGVVSLDELLDAEIELTQAQNSLYDAHFSLRLAEINLALASAENP